MDTLRASANVSSVFTSVVAGSKHVGASIPPQIDYVFEMLSTTSPWTLLLTLFAMCVVYDQGMSVASRLCSYDRVARPMSWPQRINAYALSSELYHEQRLHCWASLEDAIYWTIPPVHGS